MLQVEVKPLGRTTSALGFGCVGLTVAGGRREAFRLLETAFDCGIRHFDVARAYGMGVSEQLLGEFIRRRRAEVTLTTKFGIDPPAFGHRIPFLSAVKRVLKRVPAIDRRIRQRVSSATTMGNFSLATARRSLDASLRALRTDYIDIWLLHEGGLIDAASPELLTFLVEQQRAGTIRAFGLGSEFARFEGDCARFPLEHRVFQFDNSVVSPNRNALRNRGDRTIITHSPFKDRGICRRYLSSNPAAAIQFHDATGVDPRDERNLHGLLLTWALYDNPDGIVLFGSASTKNIRANVAALEDGRLSQPVAKAFQNLLTDIAGTRPGDDLQEVAS